MFRFGADYEKNSLEFQKKFGGEIGGRLKNVKGMLSDIVFGLTKCYNKTYNTVQQTDRNEVCKQKMPKQDKTVKQPLILASSSPRRIQLLKQSGVEAQIIKPQVEEILPKGISMRDAVMYLAFKKAAFVERTLQEDGNRIWNELGFGKKPNGIILAADTIVYKNKMIGKPKDRAEALEIFRALCGTDHQVATGAAILEMGSENRRVFCEVTQVFFREYEESEILEYLKTDEPWDKAGGYGIQGSFSRHISHIVGDYENVIGLPVQRIRKELQEMGLEVFPQM